MNNGEKSSKWYEKAKKGEKGYDMIARSNGKWYYTSRNDVEEISALTIIKAVGKKYECFYQWEDGKMTKEKDFSIVIKDDQKLMLMDSEEGIFAFGLSEADDNVTDIVIIFVVKNVSTTITASKDTSEIEIRYCILASQKDILIEVLNYFFSGSLDDKTTEADDVEMRGNFNDISN